MPGPGRLRQTEIFLAGLVGRRAPIPRDARELEARALARMSRNARAYIAGGAGAEATMAANRAAFARHAIAPRMLRDVSERDLSVTLFGRALPAPLGLAPIGVLDMAHRGADLAAARAAGAAGLPFVISSQACAALEEIAEAARPGPVWFQLYWSARDEVAQSFLRRAEAAGCEAIVLTLDTTELGWRPRDLSRGYLPFLRGRGIANYVSDPAFRALAETPPPLGCPPRPGPAALASALELLRRRPRDASGRLGLRETVENIRRFVSTYSRPDLVWDDLARLRGWTSLPILLKGVTHPQDARLAAEAGMDGLIVSNHGGRQVDGAVAALDALPGVVEAAGARLPVLFDSGVRTGADIAKALALGARAVLIGRPYAYALALAGERGVRELLADLTAELDLTLGLSGRRSPAELDAEFLRPAATPDGTGH